MSTVPRPVSRPSRPPELHNGDRMTRVEFHRKRREYGRHRVLEYLVLSLADQQLRWFDLKDDQELQPESEGLFRIRSFPGLWISGPAVLAQDYKGLMEVLHQGLATTEHRA